MQLTQTMQATVNKESFPKMDKPKIDFTADRTFLVVQDDVMHYCQSLAERGGYNADQAILDKVYLPIGHGGALIQYPGTLGDPLDQMIFRSISECATAEVRRHILGTAKSWKSGHLAWVDIRSKFFPLGPEHRVKYQSELWSLKYDGVENEPVQDFFDRVRELSNRIYWSGGASSEGDVKGAIERALASCPVLKPVITNGHLYDLAGLEFQGKKLETHHKLTLEQMGKQTKYDSHMAAFAERRQRRPTRAQANGATRAPASSGSRPGMISLGDFEVSTRQLATVLAKRNGTGSQGDDRGGKWQNRGSKGADRDGKGDGKGTDRGGKGRGRRNNGAARRRTHNQAHLSADASMADADASAHVNDEYTDAMNIESAMIAAIADAGGDPEQEMHYYSDEDRAFLGNIGPADLDQYIGDNIGAVLDISLDPGIVSLTDSLLALSVTETLDRDTRRNAVSAVADCDKWTIDSGCSTTLCCHRDWFQRYQEARIPIKIANGKHVYAEGYGSIKIPVMLSSGTRGYLLIQRALHVPTCPTNLLSVAQLTDYGHTVALGKHRPRIELSNDGGTVNLDRTNRLWTFSPSAAVAQ